MDGARVLVEVSTTTSDHSVEPPTPCALQAFGNAYVRATCFAHIAGLAVFVEQFAAGWSATVDGTPTPILKANTMMRAVPVAAGPHTIELAFKPPGLALGMTFTIVGSTILLGLFLVHWRRKLWASPLQLRERL